MFYYFKYENNKLKIISDNAELIHPFVTLSKIPFQQEDLNKMTVLMKFINSCLIKRNKKLKFKDEEYDVKVFNMFMLNIVSLLDKKKHSNYISYFKKILIVF